ncbi:helix-turn-helix domain-containing protein [Sungkyunkwania multivorans]|uniref:Helix-turn-helix domain-containing protein n=1 Tax=Sungkyunkwania multivorans TaxID=1173618 RepID=A0ABW3CYC1_9FLAO
MSDKYNNYIILIFNIIFCSVLFAQDSTKTSLYHSDHQSFTEYLRSLDSDSLKRSEARSYLSAARAKGDITKTAEAYLILSQLHTRTPLAITYIDSLLQVTKELQDQDYLGIGHLQKGIQYYYMSKYNEAFESLKRADVIAKENDNDYQQMVVRHYIGLLKNVTNGKNEETLNIFRENLKFFDIESYKIAYNDQYLKSLYALTDAYNRNMKLDSAIIICRKGIVESQKSNNTYLYHHFLLVYGDTKVLNKEYDIEVVDSLKKASLMLQYNKKSLAGCYLTISDVYAGRHNYLEAIHYLKKVDSMYAESPEELIIKMQVASEKLLTYYTITEDDEKKLLTIDKLISVNEAIVEEFQNLGSNITKEYDTPNLLAEKERLLNKSKKNMLFLYLAVGILLFMVIFFVIRSRKYQKRFDKLMLAQKAKPNKSLTPDRTDKERSKKIGLSEDQINIILEKLEAFERSEKITENYTLNSLAKEFGTNSAYLSKVINVFKKVNFSNYFNNLRIDIIVDRLANDKTLQSYTIDAIAKEAGFNNAQSFRLAFYKKTGLYPSYFLKQLAQKKKELSF